MWPITRFLYELTGATERPQLLGLLRTRLRISDSEAVRAITQLIDDGAFDSDLARRLELAFPERAAGLREALAATASQRGDEAGAPTASSRHRFHPHLWVATRSDRATQMTILAVTGGINRWLKVELSPTIDDEPWRNQQRLIRRTIRDHQRNARYGCEIPLFGPVVGYWYRPRLETRYWVSIDGIVHNQDYGPFEEPRARLSGPPPSLAG
jgi:hypothetical protein